MARKKKEVAPKSQPQPQSKADKPTTTKRNPIIDHARPAIAWGDSGFPTGGVKVIQALRKPKYPARAPICLAFVWRNNAPADVRDAVANGVVPEDLTPHLAIDEQGRVVQFLEVGTAGAYCEAGDRFRTVVVGRIGSNERPTSRQRLVADLLRRAIQTHLRIPRVFDRWPKAEV